MAHPTPTPFHSLDTPLLHCVERLQHFSIWHHHSSIYQVDATASQFVADHYVLSHAHLHITALMGKRDLYGPLVSQPCAMGKRTVGIWYPMTTCTRDGRPPCPV